ncbi:hypothetical protein FRC03_012278 [Tulasnella sp. 419]|nr:hypothetical protein FRC03_012278 [Tulasnella sp. 419]
MATAYIQPSARGWLRDTVDALVILEAASRNLITRIPERGTSRTRLRVESGAIYVHFYSESGIKRLSDGKSWSVSRVLGNFMLYCETESLSVESSHEAVMPPEYSQISGVAAKDLYGCFMANDGQTRCPDGFRLKPNGLVKKTLSIELPKDKLTVISYYNPNDIFAGYLQPVHQDPQLGYLRWSLSSWLLNPSLFRQPIDVGVASDGRPIYMDESMLPPTAPSSSSTKKFSRGSRSTSSGSDSGYSMHDSYHDWSSTQSSPQRMQFLETIQDYPSTTDTTPVPFSPLTTRPTHTLPQSPQYPSSLTSNYTTSYNPAGETISVSYHTVGSRDNSAQWLGSWNPSHPAQNQEPHVLGYPQPGASWMTQPTHPHSGGSGDDSMSVTNSSYSSLRYALSP